MSQNNKNVTSSSEPTLNSVGLDADDQTDMDVSMNSSILNTDTSDSSSSSEEDTANKQSQHVSIEDEIGTIADCILCKHSPICPYYQCAQGHLLCASCYATILSNEIAGLPRGKCPKCPALVIDSVYNPIAEMLSKKTSKLCYHCGQYFVGQKMKDHLKKCSKRLVKCPYSVIGCTWEGYRYQLDSHKETCDKQNLTGREALEFITSPKEQQLKVKRDVENFLSEMPGLSNQMIYKPPLGTNLVPDVHFRAGTFKAKDHNWMMDFLWLTNDEAFNGKSTISYRIKLLSTLGIDENVKLKYFVVKGAYRDEDYKVQINNVTFSLGEVVSPESVFIVGTAEYCERLLRQSGIYVRLCFS